MEIHAAKRYFMVTEIVQGGTSFLGGFLCIFIQGR